MTIEDLVSAYIKLRDEIRRKEEAHEEEMMELRAQLEALSEELKKRLLRDNINSVRTVYGTAMLRTKTFARVADWDAFVEFLKRENGYHLLAKSVSKNAVQEYIEANRKVPDGVDFIQILDVSVRRD